MPVDAPFGPEPAPAEDAGPESAKRKQILEGARRVFFGRGFEAASMGEIAREAGVSKGTLYVYFDSKQALFTALIGESRRATAEAVLHELDPDNPDVATSLRSFAVRLIGKMGAPEHIALVRMVIGAAEKFPELARIFFEAGPAEGARRLTAYLEAQVRHGRLAIADPELAAWQFLGMCVHPVLISVMLAARPMPDPARVAKLADAAVATFLAAHSAPPS